MRPLPRSGLSRDIYAAFPANHQAPAVPAMLTCLRESAAVPAMLACLRESAAQAA